MTTCLIITVALFFWMTFIRQENSQARQWLKLTLCGLMFLCSHFYSHNLSWGSSRRLHKTSLSFLASLYLPMYTSCSQDDQDSGAVVAVPSSSRGIHLPVWSSLGCTSFGPYCSLYCCVRDKSRVALSKLGIADICMTVCMLDHNQKPSSAPPPPIPLTSVSSRRSPSSLHH